MLEDDLKKFFEIMNSSKERKMVLKRVGRNKNGKERMLFYATAGTNLGDYAVYNNTPNSCSCFFRFRDELMKEDVYVCLFVDDSKSYATMSGRKIKTYHMGLKNKIFTENVCICLIKISETQNKNIDEG